MSISKEQQKLQKEKRLGEERVMKCGLKCKIIDYIRYMDITVEFENGTIVKNKTYSNFKNREINDGNRIYGTKHKLLTGNKFDKLTILKLKENKITADGSREYFYFCHCDCGNDCVRSAQSLRSKSHFNSCGKCAKNKEDSVYYSANNFVKYFKDINDTYRYTIGSSAIVDTICPNCNNERRLKVGNMIKRGFVCPNCSDGISYPEKFIAEFLKQGEIYFERQIKFDWAKTKIYDFYIPSISCIIETHGLQHYKKRTSMFKRTLEEERLNDTEKEKLATKNGISEYIQLDCSLSEIEYIKNSILNSKIIDFICIDNIDFLLCGEKANKSMLKEVCDYWQKSEDKTIKNICNKFKISSGTAREYLKRGEQLGLCDYDANLTRSLYLNKKNLGKHKCKKIKCIELNKNFSSMKECSIYMEKITGLPFLHSSLYLNCQGKRKQYKGYHFEFI